MFYSELPHSCTKSVVAFYEPALKLIAPCNILPSLQLYAPYHWWRLDILQYPLILHQSVSYSDKHWASMVYLRTANVFSAFFCSKVPVLLSLLQLRLWTVYFGGDLSAKVKPGQETTLAVQKDMWEKQLFVVHMFHLFYTQLLTHSSVSSSQWDLSLNSC